MELNPIVTYKNGHANNRKRKQTFNEISEPVVTVKRLKVEPINENNAIVEMEYTNNPSSTTSTITMLERPDIGSRVFDNYGKRKQTYNEVGEPVVTVKRLKLEPIDENNTIVEKEYINTPSSTVYLMTPVLKSENYDDSVSCYIKEEPDESGDISSSDINCYDSHSNYNGSNETERAIDLKLFDHSRVWTDNTVTVSSIITPIMSTSTNATVISNGWPGTISPNIDSIYDSRSNYSSIERESVIDLELFDQRRVWTDNTIVVSSIITPIMSTSSNASVISNGWPGISSPDIDYNYDSRSNYNSNESERAIDFELFNHRRACIDNTVTVSSSTTSISAYLPVISNVWTVENTNNIYYDNHCSCGRTGHWMSR